MEKQKLTDEQQSKVNEIQNMFKPKKLSGVELISKERQHQIDKHGFTAEHHALNSEKWYSKNQLMEASVKIGAPVPYNSAPENWDEEWFKKLCDKPYKDRLIIAGALIAAELDRLNYLEENNTGDRV